MGVCGEGVGRREMGFRGEGGEEKNGRSADFFFFGGGGGVGVRGEYERVLKRRGEGAVRGMAGSFVSIRVCLRSYTIAWD